MQTLTIILFALCSNLQSPPPFQLDENFSFELPAPHTRKDSLSQTVIRCQTRHGDLVVSKIAGVATAVYTRDQLIHFYNSFQHGFVTPDATVTVDSLIYIEGLLAKRFAVIRSFENDALITDATLVIVQGDIYAFMYTYLFSHTRDAHPQRDAFLASIRVKQKLSEADQIIEDKMWSIGETTGRVLRYASIALLGVVAILWALKKFRTIRIVKLVVAVLLIFWGLANLMLYIGNTLMDTQSYNLITLGMVAFLGGVFLLFVRLPGVRG